MIALLQSIHKSGRRLWDQWKDLETGETISSATLIVTAANDFTRPIHDRMPVLLGRRDHDAWLTGKAGAKLLRPAPNDLLRMWPVSKRVNVSAGETMTRAWLSLLRIMRLKFSARQGALRRQRIKITGVAGPNAYFANLNFYPLCDTEQDKSKIYDAIFALTPRFDPPRMLVRSHSCRQILYCRVCQSGQATPHQNIIQCLANFMIPASA